MVRRSILVYDLLRNEQPADGFSEKQILARISDKYDIAVSKTLQRDVAVALRCGLDFGILAKKRNKFRFEPDLVQGTSMKRNIVGRDTRTKKRKLGSKKKASGRSTTAKGRRRERRRSPAHARDRKQSARVPRPRLPRPPSWSPKRRNLAEEPIPKVKQF